MKRLIPQVTEQELPIDIAELVDVRIQTAYQLIKYMDSLAIDREFNDVGLSENLTHYNSAAEAYNSLTNGGSCVDVSTDVSEYEGYTI